MFTSIQRKEVQSVKNLVFGKKQEKANFFANSVAMKKYVNNQVQPKIQIKIRSDNCSYAKKLTMSVHSSPKTSQIESRNSRVSGFAESRTISQELDQRKLSNSPKRNTENNSIIKIQKIKSEEIKPGNFNENINEKINENIDENKIKCVNIEISPPKYSKFYQKNKHQESAVQLILNENEEKINEQNENFSEKAESVILKKNKEISRPITVKNQGVAHKKSINRNLDIGISEMYKTQGNSAKNIMQIYKPNSKHLIFTESTKSSKYLPEIRPFMKKRVSCLNKNEADILWRNPRPNDILNIIGKIKQDMNSNAFL